MPVIQNFQAFMDGGGLVCPAGKSKIEWAVADEPGLFVECRQSATAVPVWYLRLKNSAGTNVYKKLGTIRDVNLGQARRLVKQIRAQHSVTVKAMVAQSVSVVPAEMTWDVLYRDHLASHFAATIRSAKKYQQLQRIYVSPRFGTLPLGQINRRDVQAMHNQLLKEKGLSPATADHVVKYMRRALNLAVQWDYLEKNPLKNFELYLEANEIENYLDPVQLESLISVCRTDKNRLVSLVLLLLLSTGARVNEALTATWKNISIENRVWKVEAAKSKNKKIRTIPLNDSALWVLQQLDTQGKSEYLFPSPVTGKPQLSITRPWYRIRKLAGVNIRIHDLRHGFASMLVSGGRSLYEVQQILGHSDPKVTMRYAHLSSKTLQEAANAGSVIVPRVG